MKDQSSSQIITLSPVKGRYLRTLVAEAEWLESSRFTERYAAVAAWRGWASTDYAAPQVVMPSRKSGPCARRDVRPWPSRSLGADFSR